MLQTSAGETYFGVHAPNLTVFSPWRALPWATHCPAFLKQSVWCSTEFLTCSGLWLPSKWCPAPIFSAVESTECGFVKSRLLLNPFTVSLGAIRSSALQTILVWEGKLGSSKCLLTWTHYMTLKSPASQRTSEGRSQGEPSWQGTFFLHRGLEILCVDDWLSPTRVDIQAGACLSLRFNKTCHIVPH